MTTRVPILLYHSIADDRSAPSRRWVVRPATFAAQMAYLEVHGYTALTVTQFARYLGSDGSSLPERPVVITFDDGLADFYTAALPVLIEHDLVATLYVTTGQVGGTMHWLPPSEEPGRPMMTWDQVVHTAASGVECGAHTVYHPQLDTLSLDTARDEIRCSKWTLEQQLGRAVTSFAYPHGYYSPAVRREVQEAGYEAACGVKHALSAPCDDRYALARVIVTEPEEGEDRLAAFAALLQGQGLRVAPSRERVRTKGWRVVRRSRAMMERRLAPVEEGPREIPMVGAVAAGRAAIPAAAGALRAASVAISAGVAAAESAAALAWGAPAHEPAPRLANAEPLLVPDLLLTLEPLARLLVGAVRASSWLNAYLLAAGMLQIVEDELHPDPAQLGKVAGYLRRLPAPAGPMLAGAARLLAILLVEGRRLPPAHARMIHWQLELQALVQQLARLVVDGVMPATSATTVVERTEALVAALPSWPATMRQAVIRLPSSFVSFDQQPADLARLAREFVGRWPDRNRPLVVVGIRTSGSYLAPLAAAFLQAQGMTQVRTLTVRPGRRWLRHERAALQAAGRRDALVLLTDDPPSTGATIADAAQQLERLGIPGSSVVLLLQLFGPESGLPPCLHRYPAVLLPWHEWTIHKRLTPQAVRSALATMLAPSTRVAAVDRLAEPAPPTARGHLWGRYRVHLVDVAGGQAREEQIVAEGVGLGYFGEHALAIAHAVRPFVPQVYGVHQGLLYRAWVPEESRVRERDLEPAAEHGAPLVDYLVARHRALGVAEDSSRLLLGSLPVWEVASNLLSRAFGRGWLVVRVPLMDPIVRRLLRCRQPSVIDGRMTLEHCFIGPGQVPAGAGGIAPRRLVKVAFAGGAFSNRNLACYDPVFDLACLAASLDLACPAHSAAALQVLDQLRARYTQQTDEPISEERWLLYQLVHLWDRERSQDGEVGLVRRAFARALQRYLAATHFADLATPLTGALCALDIDGVLESEVLGFSGLTASSALALRAMLRHGYRPVLVSGRSLAEVQERCVAYHLPGGVAEYGAAVYVQGTGEVRLLLTAAERASLDRLRARLRALPGVHLDPDYQEAVRAFERDARRHRRGLNAALVAEVLASADPEHQLRAVPGDAQTDFVVARIDKGVGLRALADVLGMPQAEASEPIVALAVGDTASDLPMLALAARPYAPHHADRAVRAAGVPVLSGAYQRGLAQAVGRLLGHAPGGCAVCRVPQVSAEARQLLRLLSVQEAGRWGLVQRAAVLAGATWVQTLRERLRGEER